MVDVWRTYRMRGDAENRIKKLKQDFGAESFNMKDFYATQSCLDFFDDSLQFNVAIPSICSARKNAKNTIYAAL